MSCGTWLMSTTSYLPWAFGLSKRSSFGSRKRPITTSPLWNAEAIDGARNAAASAATVMIRLMMTPSLTGERSLLVRRVLLDELRRDVRVAAAVVADHRQ